MSIALLDLTLIDVLMYVYLFSINYNYYPDYSDEEAGGQIWVILFDFITFDKNLIKIIY